MIQFKRYSSIENSFNKEYIEKLVMEMPTELEYVVQEKVHGANTSFLCDGEKVSFAKRTAKLVAGEDFYNYEELLEVYKPKVLNLYNNLKQRYLSMTGLSLYGEMFGGAYPHNDVKKDRGIKLIQKGVYYCAHHEFYAFDIYTQEGGFYLPVNEANEYYEQEGFFYAKTIFEGTLKECLEYPNAFQSKISSWLGLPEIEDNICEGVVIKPLVPMFLRNGNRVIIKNKNERFAEKKSVKVRNKLYVEPVPFSDGLKALLEEVDAFVTENRLANVVSHIGEVSYPRDFGKVMGLFAKDIFEDFSKEFGGSFSILDKYEQKSFTRELNKAATALVKKVVINS